MSAADAAMEQEGIGSQVLVFVQIGDLHLTDERQRNHLDMLSIVAQIENRCGDAIDFVVLPGDNADDGEPAQYALARTALRMLSRPVHGIPGDHDMAGSDLDAFHRVLAAAALPRAETVRGVRCLFLDVSGRGSGGPDFRLGAEQLEWPSEELREAAARGEPATIVMHAYPADLGEESEKEALNALLVGHDVALVAMGHTHYNEIGNDGRTVFAATRSTGQIEEGPPSYAVVTMDGGAVGWRFKALDDPFPFVVVTSPPDHRLARDAAPRAVGPTSVRALVLGREPVESVACRAAEIPWTPWPRSPAGEPGRRSSICPRPRSPASRFGRSARAVALPNMRSRSPAPSTCPPHACATAATPTASALGRRTASSAHSSAPTATVAGGDRKGVLT